MTPSDAHDATADRLDRLMTLAPDPDRAERVRVKCRAQLGRHERRAARTAEITGFAWNLLAPTLVSAFCVLYVVVLVATTLRLETILH